MCAAVVALASGFACGAPDSTVKQVRATPTANTSGTQNLCGGRFPSASTLGLRAVLELDSKDASHNPTGSLTLTNTTSDSTLWLDWLSEGRKVVASAIDDSGAVETTGNFSTALQRFSLVPGKSVKLDAMASLVRCGDDQHSRIAKGSHEFAALLRAGTAEDSTENVLTDHAQAQVP